LHEGGEERRNIRNTEPIGMAAAEKVPRVSKRDGRVDSGHDKANRTVEGGQGEAKVRRMMTTYPDSHTRRAQGAGMYNGKHGRTYSGTGSIGKDVQAGTKIKTESWAWTVDKGKTPQDKKESAVALVGPRKVGDKTKARRERGKTQTGKGSRI